VNGACLPDQSTSLLQQRRLHLIDWLVWMGYCHELTKNETEAR